MGQLSCKQMNEADMPVDTKKPKVCASAPVKGSVLEAFFINELRGDAFADLVKLCDSRDQLMDNVKLIYELSQTKSHGISPIGDWNFLPSDINKTITCLTTQLRGFNLTREVQIAKVQKRPVVACYDSEQRSRILSDNQFFVLSLASPQSTQCWNNPSHLLFSLNRDGESWGRFISLVDGYKAPIFILIKAREFPSRVLGAYVNGGIEETGSRFAGTPDDFIFGIASDHRSEEESTITIRRSTNFEKNFYMLNRSSQYMPKGLGFGGDNKDPRLFVSADFTLGSCLVACRTYESGSLLGVNSDEYKMNFHLADLEVWGFGGSDALAEQNRLQATREEVSFYPSMTPWQMKSDRRKVDLAKMMGNDPTGLFKKNVRAGERQGETDVILEERRREKELKEAEANETRF